MGPVIASVDFHDRCSAVVVLMIFIGVMNSELMQRILGLQAFQTIYAPSTLLH